MVHTISQRSITAETPVRFQASPCLICSGKGDTGTGFSPIGIFFGGGGGFNKFSWGQRVERTGIWGRKPPSQGFHSICKWVKPVFWLGYYGCIFHGTGNSPRLCKNLGISGRFKHPNPSRYVTASVFPGPYHSTNATYSSSSTCCSYQKDERIDWGNFQKAMFYWKSRSAAKCFHSFFGFQGV
jgi:hypothetical protein